MTVIVDNEEQRREFLFKMNAQVDEWTSKIISIKSKVDKNTLQVRNDYHHNLADCCEKKRYFKEKLEEILAKDISHFESLRFGAQRAGSLALGAYNKFVERALSPIRIRA